MSPDTLVFVVSAALGIPRKPDGDYCQHRTSNDATEVGKSIW